jgi:hypothetical protein
LIGEGREIYAFKMNTISAMLRVISIASIYYDSKKQSYVIIIRIITIQSNALVFTCLQNNPKTNEHEKSGIKLTNTKVSSEKTSSI